MVFSLIIALESYVCWASVVASLAGVKCVMVQSASAKPRSPIEHIEAAPGGLSEVQEAFRTGRRDDTVYTDDILRGVKFHK